MSDVELRRRPTISDALYLALILTVSVTFGGVKVVLRDFSIVSADLSNCKEKCLFYYGLSLFVRFNATSV